MKIMDHVVALLHGQQRRLLVRGNSVGRNRLLRLLRVEVPWRSQHRRRQNRNQNMDAASHYEDHLVAALYHEPRPRFTCRLRGAILSSGPSWAADYGDGAAISRGDSPSVGGIPEGHASRPRYLLFLARSPSSDVDAPHDSRNGLGN